MSVSFYTEKFYLYFFMLSFSVLLLIHAEIGPDSFFLHQYFI